MIREEGSIPGNLESARFFHGRTAREIRRQRNRSFFDSRRDAVPTAISCIIERSGLRDVALGGFHDRDEQLLLESPRDGTGST